jgi:hypothetical protein
VHTDRAAPAEEQTCVEGWLGPMFPPFHDAGRKVWYPFSRLSDHPHDTGTYPHPLPLNSMASGWSSLRHHDLLAEQHTPASETQRERVVLQGSLDGLDGRDTWGAVQHNLAHDTPGVDGSGSGGSL